MEKDNNLKNIKVETYAEDMAQAIEDSEGGVIKKIIHEQEEKEAEKKNISPESKRNKRFMLVGVFFIVVALLLIGSVISLRQKAATVPVAPEFTPIIFTDQSQFLPVDDLSKDQIAATVLNEMVNTTVKVGGVEGIYLTENKKTIGLNDFITLINGSITSLQLKPFSDNFLIGITNEEVGSTLSPKKNLFILLKMSSFADVLPGMKTWENKMFYDLHGFFGVPITTDTNYLLTKDFTDGIIGNQNARILYDTNGNIVMMYVVADDNSLILTNDEVTAGEIISRLTSGQIKK
jgi:predicted nucleic acid-binding Zn ribbon protein